MVQTVIVSLICLLAFFLWKRSKGKETYEKYKCAVLLLGIMELMGLILSLRQWYEAGWGFSGRLAREDMGQGSYTEELEFSSSVYSGSLDVEVEDKWPDQREAEKKIEDAIAEIDASFLGENESLDQIYRDVQVSENYQEGQVEADWSFDDYTYVSADGKLKTEELEEDSLVEASVLLTCGPYQEIYNFSFCLCPSRADCKEGLLRQIQKSIRDQSRESGDIVLPEEVAGIALHWKKAGNGDGALLSLLGLLVCFLLPYGDRKERERQRDRLRRERKKDYPLVVDQLALFLSAGITLPEAARKMTEAYEKRKKRTGKVQAGFELWKFFSYEMREGVQEGEAIAHMGMRSELKEYKKLALLLEQNRRQGSEKLVQQLEEENLLAYEMRKNQARKAGEEASVKLLFPMLGMLGIVIVILLLPAMMTMGSL